MNSKDITAHARLRLVLRPGFAIGPGKAELLQEIDDSGSIAAAGRRMAMSYKRAWSLVEELNASFLTPLVETSKGGPDGGGARLTGTGKQVLAIYRRIEARTNSASRDELRELGELLDSDSPVD